MEIKNLNKILNEYQNNGFLISAPHPIYPIRIWNYTHKTQAIGKWDEITCSHRATVRDNDGNLIARSFSKFFNIEENKHTPTDKFQIFEKIDGSLCILFNYKDNWIFSSRGSFTSEQSIIGQEILKNYNYKVLDKNLTYSFELIYPKNKIVVDYGNDKKLILLAIFDNTGKEYDILKYSDIFEIAQEYKYNDYKNIQNLNHKNKEGFVVKFENGDRCKIKFKNYIETKKILGLINKNNIISHILKNGNIDKLLNEIPKEFKEHIINIQKDILKGYTTIKNQILKDYQDIPKLESKQEFANYILSKKNIKYSHILFELYDKKDITMSIYKIMLNKKN